MEYHRLLHFKFRKVRLFTPGFYRLFFYLLFFLCQRLDISVVSEMLQGTRALSFNLLGDQYESHRAAWDWLGNSTWHTFCLSHTLISFS